MHRSANNQSRAWYHPGRQSCAPKEDKTVLPSLAMAEEEFSTARARSIFPQKGVPCSGWCPQAGRAALRVLTLPHTNPPQACSECATPPFHWSSLCISSHRTSQGVTCRTEQVTEELPVPQFPDQVNAWCDSNPSWGVQTLSQHRQHYLGPSSGGAELSDCPGPSGDGSKWIIQQNIAKLNGFSMEKQETSIGTLGNIKKKEEKSKEKRAWAASALSCLEQALALPGWSLHEIIGSSFLSWNALCLDKFCFCTFLIPSSF